MRPDIAYPALICLTGLAYALWPEFRALQRMDRDRRAEGRSGGQGAFPARRATGILIAAAGWAVSTPSTGQVAAIAVGVAVVWAYAYTTPQGTTPMRRLLGWAAAAILRAAMHLFALFLALIGVVIAAILTFVAIGIVVSGGLR